jgi:hypothetical protein
VLVNGSLCHDAKPDLEYGRQPGLVAKVVMLKRPHREGIGTRLKPFLSELGGIMEVAVASSPRRPASHLHGGAEGTAESIWLGLHNRGEQKHIGMSEAGLTHDI